MTRTPVDRGFVMGWLRVLRIGSPNSLIRWMVMDSNLRLGAGILKRSQMSGIPTIGIPVASKK
jgi:hypothetical protein